MLIKANINYHDENNDDGNHYDNYDIPNSILIISASSLLIKIINPVNSKKQSKQYCVIKLFTNGHKV